MKTLWSWTFVDPEEDYIPLTVKRSSQVMAFVEAEESKLFGPIRTSTASTEPSEARVRFSNENASEDAIIGITREICKSNEINLQKMAYISSRDRWSRMSPLTKKSYLNAFITIEYVVPEEPTPFIQQAFTASSPAEFCQLINHQFSKANVAFRNGLFTDLYQCLFFSLDNGEKEKNYNKSHAPL